MKFSEWIINESANTRSWGYHLILDMSGCNDNINNEKLIRKFIKELVREIDMIAVGKPTVRDLLMGQPNEGFSVMQLIETSSITAHFVRPTNTVYCDIFSCKPFKPEDAIRVVKKYFAPETIDKCFIHRDAIRGSSIKKNFSKENFANS